jgi:hypothetical protein
MKRKLITAVLLSGCVLGLGISSASASTININSQQWLGTLKLDKAELKTIKKAVKKALNSPIDHTLQCGAVRQDCEVRAAREWKFEGDTYREIVIDLHTRGHASSTVSKTGGKWPKVVAK